jgi:hypothetical protein
VDADQDRAGEFMTATFATCTYQEFQPGMGVPVRSTVGSPRWPLPYKLREAAPGRAMLAARKAGGTHAEFRVAYMAKLDGIGPEHFAIAARAISEVVPVVLLCFDKLWLPGVTCHRTVFGDWWLDRTGEVVPELGRTEPDPVPAVQPALF